MTRSKMLAPLILSVVSLHGQAYPGLFLPNPRHIASTVVDSEGNPIADARIDHSDDPRYAYVTDSKGAFELDTMAPALVVRKAGYRSEFLRTHDGVPARITLQKLSPGSTFPLCSPSGSFVGVDGWGSSFHFPRISGVTVSAQGADIDYGARSYYIKTKSGAKGIRHGSGPMWSLGIPADRDVWQSAAYEESSYESGRITIIERAR